MDMKMEHSRGEDRLSALPDALLTKILSLLPFESVTATSTLSRRWQHLWTQLPSISVTRHYTPPTKVSLFWTKFNKYSSKLTFPLSRSLILDLHPAFFNAMYCPSFSDSWFRQICGSYIQQIQLTSKSWAYDYDFVVPSNYVFQMQSLKVLELGGCFAWSLPSDTTSIVHLPNLNKLSIHVVCYQFNLLERLISSIPSLEDLSFRVNCGGTHNCHILEDDDEEDDPVVDHVSLQSPNLKRLCAKVYSIQRAAVILIDAPLLQYLQVESKTSCYYPSRFYFVQRPTLLREAVTMVKDWSCSSCDTTLVGVSEAVSNVRSLVIKGSSKFAESLSSSTYPNLSTLTCRLASSTGIETLQLLLKGCPVLRFLKLDLKSYYAVYTENRENPSDFTTACMLTHVKIIELNLHYFSRPMRLIKHLLTSTCVLEQLNINFAGQWTDTAEKGKRIGLQFLRNLVKCQKKLLHCYIQFSGFGLKLSCHGMKLLQQLSSRTVSLC